MAGQEDCRAAPTDSEVLSEECKPIATADEVAACRAGNGPFALAGRDDVRKRFGTRRGEASTIGAEESGSEFAGAAADFAGP